MFDSRGQYNGMPEKERLEMKSRTCLERCCLQTGRLVHREIPLRNSDFRIPYQEIAL